jgi:hypothetical protein
MYYSVIRIYNKYSKFWLQMSIFRLSKWHNFDVMALIDSHLWFTIVYNKHLLWVLFCVCIQTELCRNF